MILWPSISDPDGWPGIAVGLTMLMVAGVIVAMVWFMFDHLSASVAEDARMRTHMRECVPSQGERRCYELWRWVESDKSKRTLER